MTAIARLEAFCLNKSICVKGRQALYPEIKMPLNHDPKSDTLIYFFDRSFSLMEQFFESFHIYAQLILVCGNFNFWKNIIFMHQSRQFNTIGTVDLDDLKEVIYGNGFYITESVRTEREEPKKPLENKLIYGDHSNTKFFVVFCGNIEKVIQNDHMLRMELERLIGIKAYGAAETLSRIGLEKYRSAEYLNYIGIIYSSLGKYAASLSFFFNALEEDSLNSNYILNIVSVFEKTKRYDKAIGLLTQFLEKKKDPDVMAKLSQLKIEMSS